MTLSCDSSSTSAPEQNQPPAHEIIAQLTARFEQQMQEERKRAERQEQQIQLLASLVLKQQISRRPLQLL